MIYKLNIEISDNILGSMSMINIKHSRCNNNVGLDHPHAARFSTSGFNSHDVIIIDQNTFESFTFILRTLKNNLTIKNCCPVIFRHFANNICKFSIKVNIRERERRNQRQHPDRHRLHREHLLLLA